MYPMLYLGHLQFEPAGTCKVKTGWNKDLEAPLRCYFGICFQDTDLPNSIDKAMITYSNVRYASKGSLVRN